jgi:hypothetical protein
VYLCCSSNGHNKGWKAGAAQINQTSFSQQYNSSSIWPDYVVHLGSNFLPRQIWSAETILRKVIVHTTSPHGAFKPQQMGEVQQTTQQLKVLHIVFFKSVQGLLIHFYLESCHLQQNYS